MIEQHLHHRALEQAAGPRQGFLAESESDGVLVQHQMIDERQHVGDVRQVVLLWIEDDTRIERLANARWNSSTNAA